MRQGLLANLGGALAVWILFTPTASASAQESVVVRGARNRLTTPRVVNQTRSIEVLGVEVSDEKSEFVVTLKNASGRSIMAMQMRLMKNGREKAYRPDSYMGEKPWALPGAVWKASLSGVDVADKVSAEGHSFEQPDEIVIASALFSDGSYEGEASFAVAVAAGYLGTRIQAGRALPMLRDAEREEREGAGIVDVAKELRRKAETLPLDADRARMEEFLAKYPELTEGERTRVKEAFASGLEIVRKGIMVELDPVVDGKHSQPDPRWFRYWLNFVRQRYEHMISFN